MYEILHKITGETLARLPDGLHNAKLAGMDLRHANLRHACLTEADLSGTLLSGADLRGAMLNDCNLRDAKLMNADLTGASLTGGNMAQARLNRTDLRLATFRRIYMRGCDFRHSDLRGARFEAVDLEDAVLNHCVLRRAVFFGANFRGANLTSVSLGDTALQCCANLHEARGLHGVSHVGPSWIDLQTLRASAAALPEIFLHGLGVTRREADMLRSLYTGRGSLENVYVVATPDDNGLTWSLVSDLRARNIPAWPQPVDNGRLASRRRLRAGPSSSNRMIFVCSKELLRTPEAAEIAITAIESERRARIQVLFPISVDQYLFSDEFLMTADNHLNQGLWRLDWVRYLRALQVADWSRWQEAQPYESLLDSLARDLHTPARR